MPGTDTTLPPDRFDGDAVRQLEAFCDDWLRAWTRADPDRIVAFYAEDCWYFDPGNPDGIRGTRALHRYVARLATRVSSWRWTRRWLVPAKAGFVLRWQLDMGQATPIEGMDAVELAPDGRILRNEVFFDARRWVMPQE